MVINYTTVLSSRFDAPYVGTLIAGCNCYSAKCKGCFNQHLKDMPNKAIDADILLDKIFSDPFCEGIILAGLEWCDGQYDEALYLIKASLSRGKKATLYTRQTEEYMRSHHPELFSCSGLYIKVGEFIEEKRVYDYKSYGVPLATSNQYIIKVD